MASRRTRCRASLSALAGWAGAGILLVGSLWIATLLGGLPLPEDYLWQPGASAISNLLALPFGVLAAYWELYGTQRFSLALLAAGVIGAGLLLAKERWSMGRT